MNDMKNSSRPESRSFGAGARRSGLGCSLALALLLVALVAGAAVAGPRLLRFFDTRSDVTPLSASASEKAQQQSEQRTQQLAELNQYGWVDQNAGIAHIPIARAIALIAAQGLPVGIPPTATPAPAEAISATAEITATEPTVDLNNLDFARDVLPIFEAHCTKCHGGDNPEEGLELTSRKKILAGSLNGSVVKPGDPEQSYLVEMISTDKMPKKGPPLTQMEKDIIIAWIKAGAPDSPTPAETSPATGTLSTTAPITATAQLSTSAQVSATAPVSPSATLSESAPLTATALATPTLDLSSVDLNHIHFSTDVLPIFEAHCTKCHGGDNPEEGLELTSRKKVLAGSLNGSVVKPGDPDASYLVKMITEGKMPKRGAPLSQLEIDIIVAWIKAGALDDEPAASSTLTSTTTVSATLSITATPTATTRNVTPTVVASATHTATVASQIRDSKPVTPTSTLTATKSAATATPTATKGVTATVTRTPTVTPVEKSAPVTSTLAATITDTTAITSSVATSVTNPSAAPITETTTVSSTFDPSKVDLSNVSFSNNVLPIFEQHCFKCHGDIDNPEEGLQLTSRKKVMAGSLNGGVVSPGKPDESYLVEMIVKGKMPKKGEPLTQTEIDIIVAWIEQGALDN